MSDRVKELIKNEKIYQALLAGLDPEKNPAEGIELRRVQYTFLHS